MLSPCPCFLVYQYIEEQEAFIQVKQLNARRMSRWAPITKAATYLVCYITVIKVFLRRNKLIDFIASNGTSTSCKSKVEDEWAMNSRLLGCMYSFPKKILIDEIAHKQPLWTIIQVPSIDPNMGDNFKHHLVRWDTVCTQTANGGLGV